MTSFFAVLQTLVPCSKMSLFSLKTCIPVNLVAPYRALLRYYRCDTPYRAIVFREISTSPKWCDTPPPLLLLCFAPWVLAVFVISVLSVISANPAINPLACGCLSCLRHFRDSRRFFFCEKQRIAKHRFGKT